MNIRFLALTNVTDFPIFSPWVQKLSNIKRNNDDNDDDNNNNNIQAIHLS